MNGNIEIIRTREVRGPGGRKARHTSAQESARVEKPEIAKALFATNKGAEEVLKQEASADLAPNSFVTPEPEEVEVKVLRRCANPRLLLCIYQDEGLEHRVLVRVGKNANFSPEMQLKALRPERVTEPWGYAGPLPRFKGRW